MNHDLDLLKDARGPIKVFDSNGNFKINWYKERVKCFDFYHDRNKKEFRLFVYEDGTYQLSYLWKREPLISSW